MKPSVVFAPAVLLLLAVTPAAGQISIPSTSEVLPNGLTVILHEDHSVPVVSVNVWYHVGSGREKPGRTGFAHLFEHMLFQGSEHVGDDQHFGYIQEAGGTLNGSTSNDRTNYYETVPSQFLEMALWLEADRMGFLLPAMTQEKLDNQRDVVKNERRQRTDNQPYGRAFERIQTLLYPDGHPYSWPVIGSMEDLSAASLDDVAEFFRTYYVPNNASLVIVGDFDPEQTMTWVREYFGPIPAGDAIPTMEDVTAVLVDGKRDMMEDRVQLPRLYLAWHSPPMATQGDAVFDILSDILAGGKSSRLYKSLVYDRQIAQDVSAFQYSRKLSGALIVTVTAKPDVTLSQIEEEVAKELRRLADEPPSARELERAQNSIRANFIYGLQSTAGKADRINGYQFFWGDPGAIRKDLARYEQVTAGDIQQAVRRYIGDGRVVFSVVPEGREDLAAQ
ncbi:MAG: insulinase family protein [Ignavibacteria bacterium]|nr:insulinase family protein [Ignavibacteria bacterium]